MIRPAPALACIFLACCAIAQDAAVLKLSGPDGKTHSLTVADLRKLGPQALPAKDPHSKQQGTYQGVSLVKVLALVNAPLGDQLKGDAFADYVLVEGRDGYRVVFSLIELDPATSGTEAFVAFEKDGQPLPAGDGTRSAPGADGPPQGTLGSRGHTDQRRHGRELGRGPPPTRAGRKPSSHTPPSSSPATSGR